MKNRAFTLAEVLITLGIIGVVAAMTIPTLISNTNSAKFKSQFKKTLSTLNQAGKMAEAQYDINFASLSGYTGGWYAPDCATQSLSSSASMCSLLNSTISGQTIYGSANKLMVPGTENKYSPQTKFISGDTAVTYVTAQFLDGSLVAFPYNLRSCTLGAGEDITTLPNNCYAFIDVNGAKLPNKEVKCSNGSATIASSVGDCIVRNNSTDMGDIFPVVFHDSVVEPLTDASLYVLKNSK